MKSKQVARDTKYSRHIENKSLKTFLGITILNHHLSTTHPPCKPILHSLSVLRTSFVNNDHLQKPSFRPGHIYNYKYEKSKVMANPATCCWSPAWALVFSNFLIRKPVMLSGTSSAACALMHLPLCYWQTQDQHSCVAKAFILINKAMWHR